MSKRTVLVPLDGSAFSRQIVPHLCHLLRAGDYAVILLQVGQPAGGVVGRPPRPILMGIPVAVYERAEDLEYALHPIYATQAEASARAEIECSLLPEQTRLEDAGFDVTVQARFGDPGEEIIACAAEQHVDLIAMATHNGAVLRQMLLGSVAEYVLRNTTIPVLLVHPTAESMV